MRGNSRSVVVVTALALEFNAVRECLTDCREVIHPAGTVYQTGDFAGDTNEWDVSIVETGAGNPAATLETSRALDFFQPDTVLFVGIAGGIHGLQIGDVVAADFVYNYEPSKVTDEVLHRMKTFNCGYTLVQRARAVSRDANWHKRIVAVDQAPRSFIGPIASGEQILAHDDGETYRILRSRCDDAMAVEMEGWGFLLAAHANDDVPALVIRGISDVLIDKAPDTDRINQPLAAKHAAAFAFEVLATLGPLHHRRPRRRPKRIR